MFRKTVIALAATVASFGGLASASTSASANNYYFNSYPVHQNYQVAHEQPIYRTVTTPVYKTIQYFDNYLCRWVSRQVFDHNEYALYQLTKVWNAYTYQWEWKQTFVRYLASAAY